MFVLVYVREVCVRASWGEGALPQATTQDVANIQQNNWCEPVEDGKDESQHSNVDHAANLDRLGKTCQHRASVGGGVGVGWAGGRGLIMMPRSLLCSSSAELSTEPRQHRSSTSDTICKNTTQAARIRSAASA